MVSPMNCNLQELLSTSISWSLLKFVFSESVMLSKRLILWNFLFLLPSIFQVPPAPISQLFTSGRQSIEASVAVHPTNILGWFPLIFFIIQLKFYLLEAYRAVISSNNGSGMTFLYICFIHSFIHPTFWLLL